VPEFQYLLTDLSAYGDEAPKRTAELGVGLLLLKHIFRSDLRRQLPEIMKLWYTMRQQEHALRYLEAVIRYVASAGRTVSAEDVRAAIGAVASKEYGVLDARVRSRRGAQRKDKQRLKGDSLHLCISASLRLCVSASLRPGVKVGGVTNRRSKQLSRLASSFPQCPLAPFPISTFPVARGVAHCLTVGISRG